MVKNIFLEFRDTIICGILIFVSAVLTSSHSSFVMSSILLGAGILFGLRDIFVRSKVLFG